MLNRDQIYLGNPRLKKANVKLDYTKEQVEELAKCANDILYFCNTFEKTPEKMAHYQTLWIKDNQIWLKVGVGILSLLH